MIGVVAEQDSSKARCPIVFTDAGIETFTNELQLQKAWSPMLVTDDGIATLANEPHL